MSNSQQSKPKPPSLPENRQGRARSCQAGERPDGGSKFCGVLQSNRNLPGGDCFRACVASIFGLSLESVPHFLKDSTGGPWEQDRWDAVRNWADERGAVALYADPDTEPDLVNALYAANTYYIATGPSRNHPEFGHCVVGLGSRLVFDPLDGGIDGSKMLAGDPWLFIMFAEKPAPDTPNPPLRSDDTGDRGLETSQTEGK